MTRRSYRQYCGLAVALDVVGERWAMLIVRDLGPGPRRFTDLMTGLPGIATDVLAERLRSLEAAGAVRQTKLSSPVPANVYELTERGRELNRIGGELAGWGMPLLPASNRAHRSNARWVLQSMVRSYRRGLPDGAYHWTVDDEDLTVIVDDGRARVAYGRTAGAGLMSVRCSTKAFFAMVRRPPTDGLAPGRGTAVEGRTELLGTFFQAMPLAGVGAVR